MEKIRRKRKENVEDEKCMKMKKEEILHKGGKFHTKPTCISID